MSLLIPKFTFHSKILLAADWTLRGYIFVSLKGVVLVKKQAQILSLMLISSTSAFSLSWTMQIKLSSLKL